MAESVDGAVLASAVSRLGTGSNGNVYKDECVYSFKNAEHDVGLFVNLHTYQAVSRLYLDLDYSKHQYPVYLQIQSKKYKKPAPVNPDAAPAVAAAVPTKLAIGVEGGFSLNGEETQVKTTYNFYVYPSKRSYAFPDGLTGVIAGGDVKRYSDAAERVISATDSSKVEDAKMWMEDPPKVSKYAEHLVQLDNGKKISPNPKDWKCEDSGLTENLWLNLSTGYIGSGRRQPDGSGGTGAALRHFEETGGLYPLAVKLGTITPAGADVYSYAPEEDDTVLDPWIAQHLAHWGINMMSMKKTEKTMEELNVDLNLKLDFSAIQEEGRELEPLKGPGFTGLVNIGNSCYINSTVQTLFTIPEFKKRFFDHADFIFQLAPNNVPGDIPTQLSKLAKALFAKSEAPAEVMDVDPIDGWEYVPPTNSISPRMFRSAIGKNHPEFSTNRQQDAHEYYQYVLDHLLKVERVLKLSERDHINSLVELFLFDLEERIQCQQSGMVRYAAMPKENTLTLPIPLEKSVNQDELKAFEAVAEAEKDKKEKTPAPKAIVPFQACVDSFLESELVEGFRSPATGRIGNATKTTRLANFPPYLVVKMKRYVLAADWTPKKLDARVEVPQQFDFSAFRARGLQPNETELPKGGPAPQESVEPDPVIVSTLVSMGFSENGSKRAAVAVKNSNIDAASNWVFEHMGDADFNNPLPTAGASAAAETFSPDSIMMLESMGFSEKAAKKALTSTSGDVERAAEWLFSRAGTGELEAMVSEELKHRCSLKLGI
eukprot:TRINITY_DN1145_c0_g1_i1.p1 TRINITY_DN1145_c0_g1~~TRINITY_DN1145_c0_g1_i1.p1  ORF type:complete len:781 (-),score=220.07 TRINITY_DN1145_c0_g1_i1:510-2816(-)